MVGIIGVRLSPMETNRPKEDLLRLGKEAHHREQVHLKIFLGLCLRPDLMLHNFEINHSIIIRGLTNHFMREVNPVKEHSTMVLDLLTIRPGQQLVIHKNLMQDQGLFPRLVQIFLNFETNLSLTMRVIEVNKKVIGLKSTIPSP